MKRLLHFFVFMLLAATVNAQSLSIVRTIQKTGTIEDGGVTLDVSSDDAEQENDAIDALFDDDLDAGWEGAPEDQNILTVGLRFRDMYIPQGATIDSAYILFHSHEGKSADDVARITIVGEATDNAQTFTEDALIDARPQTSSSVLWEVAEEWDIYAPYRTADISTVIQEIVDRGGWQSGNALSLILLGENQGPSDFENAREFESFENIADPEDGGDGQHHPERVPMLFVYYSVNEGVVDIPIMATDTITDGGITFAASSDDAEQENDEIDSLFDDDLDAGWEGAPEDQNILTVGLRFRNIGIPQGAIVDSAYILFHSHEGKSADDVARITIVGEATDNAQTFTEDALIDARPQTNASVLWEVAEEWEIYEPYRTVDISNIVQEVVDRDGWDAGNAIAFMLLGENQGPSDFENAREFESFENIADPADGGDGQHHPERVPRLVIKYSSPNATSVNEIFVPAVKNLKLFPNPVNDDLVTAELDTEGASVISVYNANGQLVSTKRTAFGMRVELNVSDLPKGLYFVQARQGNELYIQKLIRQ
ncbi:MAG: T9SS type A sorting domain-containing protein [Saprospiraceae bacterium]|nr:T9SS type A sorting domain-containing protein [Saprospiraceae bacterium]